MFTSFDYAVMAVIGLSALRGMWRGLLAEVFGLIGWIAARIRGAFFIVDWHNFGYSMLVPRLGSSHWVVRMARIWERWLGRRADAHFCVSSAMREVLVDYARRRLAKAG